jgi:hypothetical protein
MFLVMDGRIYHTANSGNSGEDFLSLCGLDFPLIKAETIEDLESRYCRKEKNEIEKFKAKQIGELNDNYLKTLKGLIGQKEDAVFFFREICPAYNLFSNAKFISLLPETSIQKEDETEKEKRKSILGNIMPEKCAVINGRVYPLSFSQDNIFINVNEQSYEINRSIILLDDIEKQFQKQFEENLRQEAIAEFDSGRKKEERISDLEKELGSLEIIEGAEEHEHCYEYGNIGYDFSSKLIYWLILPHYNSTSEKSYGEGQSAVTLELENKKLGNYVKFAERNNRKTPFKIHSHTNCYGSATSMPPFDENEKDSIEDKMFLLKTCAEEVFREGNFYTAPDTSSSDDNSSSDNSSDYNYY